MYTNYILLNLSTNLKYIDIFQVSTFNKADYEAVSFIIEFLY